MAEDSERIIYHDLDKPYKGDWDDAAPEYILAGLKEGNMDAFDKLLSDIGKTRDDFLNEIAEEVAEKIRKFLDEKDTDGTVE